MNPSIELRLQSMISAMQEVVIPAIGPSSGLAREQANLVLGHLHMLQQQYDLANRFERLELAAAIRLGRQLLASETLAPAMAAAASGLAQVLAAAELDAGDVPASVQRHSELVNAAIEQLIDSSFCEGGEAFLTGCQTLIIDHGRATSLWNRSWVAATRFELGESQLPAIPAMIESFSKSVRQTAT